MLQVCSNLFGGWNKDVRYCHWKSNEHLMDGLDGKTDLDVFVLPEDKSLAEFHLRRCEFIKFVPQMSSRYPLVDEWIGFDRETGRLVHVHLHFQIITGTKFCKEYVFPIDEVIIKNRILDKESQVFIASPEIELIVLFSRIVLKSINKNHITSKSYDAELTYLWHNIDKEVLKEKCVSIIGDKGERYYELISLDCLSQRDWRELGRIIHSWLDKHRKMPPLSVFLRTNYYWIKIYKDYVLDRLFNKPVLSKKTLPNSCVSICFLGQDGCGKSTLSQDVEKWLKWKIDAHRFYLGSGEHYKSVTKWLLSKVSTFRRRGVPRDDLLKMIDVQGGSKSPKNKTAGPISSVVALLTSYDLIIIAKRALREVRRAKRYSLCGAISLFDRFPQNQFCGIYDGPKIRTLYLNKGHTSFILKRMARMEENYLRLAQDYQPSVVFKLILSPEESMRRKPFENYEQVCRKHDITNKLVFDKSEVFRIDASQDYSEELLLVKSLIWDYFLKNQ